jgi:hypothetical protein
MRVLMLIGAAVTTCVLAAAQGFGADTPNSKQATQAKPDNYAQVVLHVEGMI